MFKFFILFQQLWILTDFRIKKSISLYLQFTLRFVKSMLQRLLRLVLFFVATLLLSSCITARKINYLQMPGGSIPSYIEQTYTPEYRIQDGDRLSMRVFSTHAETNAFFNSHMQTMMGTGTMASGSNTDLFTYEVNSEGNVILPMAGEVFVRGKTLREANAHIEQSLAPFFKLSSTETRIVGRFFSVLGEGSSGFFPMFRERINIFQALALAGDVGTYSDRSEVRIVRKTQEGTIVKKFDLRSRDILTSEFYYIEPNDVIYIQTSSSRFFNVTSFPALLSTSITTISFGLFLYNLLTVDSN